MREKSDEYRRGNDRDLFDCRAAYCIHLVPERWSMIQSSSEQPITLPPGCSAEHDTCGSCKYFKRTPDFGDYYKMNGKCRFVMPKKIVVAWQLRAVDPKHQDDDYDGTEDHITDTDCCDLYRNDGKVYIVQRRIEPKVTP
jgi:hypothetical protein